MAQVSLNKSSLSKEQTNLKNYRHFLPSLDLKRRKLLAEKNKAQKELTELNAKKAHLENYLAKTFPMLAISEVNLNDIVQIKDMVVDTENIVGVKLPRITQINFTIKEYVLFNSPFWIDHLLQELKALLEIKSQLHIAEQRIQLLDKAVQVVTQRNNLFEKVLIPRTKETIRTIQIFLADNERASIVRSKIAKKKRQLQ